MEITRQKLNRIFDIIWKEAEKILAEYNPCQINVERGTCFQGCMYACRNNSQIKSAEELDKYTKMMSFCCEGCSHLGPTGCMVQALSCKLWLCKDSRELHVDAFKKLSRLREHMDRWALGSFRASKKAAVNYAYNILNRKV